MKNLILNSLLALIILVLFFTISCSSDDNSIPVTEVSSTRTVDIKLVGTWDGTVEGTMGTETAIFTLQSNGDIIAETDSQIICPFQGTWWVTNGNFTAAGEEECDGTGIDLRGSSTSNTQISGTWTAAGGNSGKFNMTKQ
ncbi:hypothetical protein [uncultured Eudoraea sp.]|jgi:hypothetical protein|uniref:hypothetical protein n=1 Tax=uncultured Eudoraea sp. TaxID=1035614 RepID=UPI00260A4156|nr:hypothetical protein [uncultured Eudoraea sp.]